MVAFGHTAIGVGVGMVTFHLVGDANPVLGSVTALGGGIVSHYLADLVPHGHFFEDPDNYKRYALPIIVFDLGLGTALFSGTA